MAHLTISSAASLTGATTASGDLFPCLDVSAASGSQGSKITRDELGDAMTRTPASLKVSGINAKLYGATGDARKVTDAVLVNGSTTVTSASAAFTSADVGKTVWGIVAADYSLRLPVTTITAVNSSTSITVANAATLSFSNVHLVFGTNDTAALQAAMTAAKAAGSNVIVPAGGYLFSALPFDGNRSSVGFASGVIGAGSNATVFYPVPGFDFSSTSPNDGIFYRNNGNGRSSIVRGFLIDGSYHSYSGAGLYAVITDRADRSIIEDVKITQARGFTAHLGLASTRTRIDRCYFEGNGYFGITMSGGSALIVDTYTGNHAYWGLYIASVAGTNNTGVSFRWVGGIIDESAGSSCYIHDSTDVVFLGARFFGGISYYGCEVASSSAARFVGCELVGYGSSGNRGGLKVNSGCIATLTSCRLHGLGTLYGLDNAGTVYDGGGNVSNNKTGAGSITIPTL